MSKEGQRQRIYKALKTGDRISMVSLHRIGAANPRGFCGCLTKRLSEIRDMIRPDGKTVHCFKRFERGQLMTEYQILPIQP